MGLLRNLSDNSKPESLANKLRGRRFAWFRRQTADLGKPIRILDVGGTSSYWQLLSKDWQADYQVEVLNLGTEEVGEPVVESHSGDARDLSQFTNQQFDLAYSNSVIEHVGGWDDQKKMADEIARVAKSYIVQTPNYYFPIEPHFLFPCFQFLPRFAQIFLVKRFKLGWTEKVANDEEAKRLVDSVQLIKESELKRLFPEAKIYREKFFGLTKSITAYRLA